MAHGHDLYRQRGGFGEKLFKRPDSSDLGPDEASDPADRCATGDDVVEPPACLHFELPHALAGDAELLAHLLERRPWTHERVLAVRQELPERYQLVIDLGVGLGLRQGEIFGLSLGDIDLNTGEIEINRQVKVLGGNRLIFGLPKGRKVRTVPLPDGVLERINQHVTRFPPRSVTLPWDRTDGKPRTVDLLLFTRETGALNRNYFNPSVWRPALKRAGLEAKRQNGCHALRHFYASTLLDSGESILALSEYLGHADPGFTLRTYTHLMPSSTERTKTAIDAMLAGNALEPDPENDADGSEP